jgi:hypothetical protein
VTGFFNARAEGGAVRLEVQLREGREASSELGDRLARALGSTLPRDVACTARFHEASAFPQRTTHERKHHYLAAP